MNFLVQFLGRLLAPLPLCAIQRLGAALGWLVYAASPTYRRHFWENTTQAGIDRKTARCSIGQAGRQMLEILALWVKPADTPRHWVREVVGWQHVEAAQEAGRGILFLTPHLGNFEITAPAYSQKAGRPITVLYRPSKWRALDALMQHRAREEMHTAPADLSGVRKLFRALKRGEAVGMLPDQTPKAGEGQWLPFFGKPAYTMTLAARLSETGATVLLAYGERLPDGEGFCLHFERPDVPIEGDTALRAQAINQEMERLILRLPGQYLWGYNRYKGRPNADLSASPSGDAP